MILGAGFDTFALRRSDLCKRLQVYEVDQPDVQALKRQRIAQAKEKPDAMPTFVPMDFESTSLTEGLGATAFDPKRRTLFSWMNTIPYLTESATEATLREIAALVAPVSRIALNYAFPRDSSSPRLAPETGVRSRRPNTAQEFAASGAGWRGRKQVPPEGRAEGERSLRSRFGKRS